MIPLEKIIPIEQKAREYGYETVIRDGGNYVQFSQYKNGGRFTVTCGDNGVSMGDPSTNEATTKTYGVVLEDRRRLLELAMMLQENIVDEKIEDEIEDDD